jgi:hypothetical protein
MEAEVSVGTAAPVSLPGLEDALSESTSTNQRPLMYWTFALVSLFLWSLGMLTAHTAGGFIHLLLLFAVATLVAQFLRPPRRPFSDPAP